MDVAGVVDGVVEAGVCFKDDLVVALGFSALVMSIEAWKLSWMDACFCLVFLVAVLLGEVGRTRVPLVLLRLVVPEGVPTSAVDLEGVFVMVVVVVAVDEIIDAVVVVVVVVDIGI